MFRETSFSLQATDLQAYFNFRRKYPIHLFLFFLSHQTSSNLVILS